MEIIVKLEGKKYKYVQVGEDFAWINEKNIIVPMFLQSELRYQAINDGVDPSKFRSSKRKLSDENDELEEKLEVKKPRKVKTSKLMGVVNVFKNKGETDEAKQE